MVKQTKGFQEAQNTIAIKMEEIWADILVLERKTDGLLGEIVGVYG